MFGREAVEIKVFPLFFIFIKNSYIARGEIGLFYLRLKNYGYWFFLNFIVCGTPFLVMIAQDVSEDIFFSGFLAFNYTLILTSIYLLFQRINSKKEKEDIPSFLITFGYLWSIIMIASGKVYIKLGSSN